MDQADRLIDGAYVAEVMAPDPQGRDLHVVVPAERPPRDVALAASRRFLWARLSFMFVYPESGEREKGVSPHSPGQNPKLLKPG